MGQGVNKHFLCGRIGNEVELRYTASGTAVLNLSIATSYKVKNKSTNQYDERTDWNNSVLWGKLAEIAAEYRVKGDEILIIGPVRTKKVEGRDGDRYYTETIAEEMELIGPSKGASSSNGAARYKQGEPAPTGSDFEDDDIPF